MRTGNEQDFATLVQRIRESSQSDFYAKHWGDATIEDLPVLSRDTLARTPLSKRRYAAGGSLLKIVPTPRGPFLSAWRFEDIRKEPYGTPSKRPMVYMTDPHETVEKSFWCTLNGMTRLVGEPNAVVSLETAEKFNIDSLIADPASALALLPYLRRRDKPLMCLSLISDAFDTDALAPFAACARHIRLVLALPETGVIAEAGLAPKPVFQTTSDCIVEHIDSELIVTSVHMLVTPVIRYRTGLRARTVDEHFFILQ